MIAFIMTMIVIWAVMWMFFKFMYPKPPKHYYPKEGDVITPRTCDYCGHDLAEYRGVLEPKPAGSSADGEEAAWFFCNYEHQASFHENEQSNNQSQSQNYES